MLGLGNAITLGFSIAYGPVLNVSNCVNGAPPYDTFANGTPTGFDAILSTTGTQLATTVDEIPFINVENYYVTFDLALNSGTAPSFNFYAAGGSTDRTVEGIQLAVAGANSFTFTANATDTVNLAFINFSTLTNYGITNLSIRQVL